MNPNTLDGPVARRSIGAMFYRNPVDPLHPLHRAFDPYARLLPDHAVETAAALVVGAPLHGRDEEANVRYMNEGYAVSFAVNKAITAGRSLSMPLVEQAHGRAAEAQRLVAAAAVDFDEAEETWSQVVLVDGEHVTRAGGYVAGDSAQRAASRAENHGDYRHRQHSTPGVWGWIAALGVTAAEFSAVYTLLWNPSNLLTLLPLVIVTVLVFAATHVVTKQTGRAIRAWRIAREARIDKLDAGYAHVHSDAATAGEPFDRDAARAHGLGQLGRATPAHSVGWLHGVLIAWGAACSALTIALVSVVSVRIFAMAMDAARGLAFSLLFAGFFGVVVLGVLGFLVYGYSRGNALGRRLAAYGALNEETDGLVESHVGSGRAALDAAEEQLVLMRADLAEAEEVEIRHNAEVIQAIQASAAVLRVTDLAFDVQRRIPLGTSIRDEIQALASSVHADAGVQRLRISGIERKEPAVPLPHESDHLERPGAVGLDELDPARVGAVVVPEQHDHRRSVRPRTLLLAALAVLVVASAIAASLVIATGAARASAAAAAPPADLVEGRDYSFLGTAANGPERWSCAAPIEVRLADGSPAGSADVVASAVASIARTSGLPLRIGSSYDAGILISYVPSPDVQRLGGSDEAIGVTSTRTDDEGAIRHADVEIAADAAVNAPGTTTAEFTMLHELGHAVGLGHATRKDEIMTPVLDPATAPVLGRGDVAALHAVGCRQS